MPEMAPLYWEILFILFIMTYVMINGISFFNFNNKIKKDMSTSTTSNKNWKW